MIADRCGPSSSLRRFPVQVAGLLKVVRRGDTSCRDFNAIIHRATQRD